MFAFILVSFVKSTNCSCGMEINFVVVVRWLSVKIYFFRAVSFTPNRQTAVPS